MGFCSNPLDKYHVGDVVHDLGLIQLIIAILYGLMALLTVFWIHVQERQAQGGSQGAVKSVIFPIFTKMMWLSAFSSVMLAFLMIFVPVHLTHGHNNWLGEILYPVAFTTQHAVMEGIAFLLMNKGCGNHAAKNTIKYISVWCAFTFVVQVITFTGHYYATYFFYTWDSLQLLFYLALWLAPLNKLYRRPAAYPYACFWFWFRVMEITFYSIAYSTNPTVESIGHCGYVFGPLLIFTLFQPLVCYYTLLLDSKWWQGILGDDDKATPGSINSPMWGMDLTLHSAQTLARTLDEMRDADSAKLVNFAHIALDTQKIIGQGSFSRVYVGTYRMQKCAIKLVYSLDLTAEEIRKVAAEATLLNSVRHKHVVHSYGVSVLPPSVCILLELCAYGSLSDVLRGSSNKKAVTLSYLDKLYLAVGCAKGLAALHSIGSKVVHRDIKSFNFLVDGQLNAKLADLELGKDDQQVDIDPECLLPNWAAPEVLLGKPYTQASDVYSLSLVLWEIVTGVIPYSEIHGSCRDNFEIIRNEVAVLHNRLAIPKEYEEIAQVIEAGWHKDISVRPCALNIVEALMNMWKKFSKSSRVTNILCEMREIANGGNLNNSERTAVDPPGAQSVSALLQAWYTTSEYKKHVQSISVDIDCNSKKPFSGQDTSTPGASSLNSIRYVSESSKSRGSELEMLSNKNEIISPHLQSLYNAICSHPDWKALMTSSTKPLLVITRSPPHIIVAASTSWCRLTGYKLVQVFGHSLDELLVVDSKKSKKSSDNFPCDEPFENNPRALNSFYEDIIGGFARTKSRSMFSRTSSVSSNYSTMVDLGQEDCQCSHALISIHKAENNIPLQLSIHGFPINLPERNDGEDDKEKNGSDKEKKIHRVFPTTTNVDFTLVIMNTLSNVAKVDEETQKRRSYFSYSSPINRQRSSTTLSERYSIT